MRAAGTVIFLVALGTFSGCQSTTNDGCYYDSDCGSGYVCEPSSGACLSPSDGGNESCRVPADCQPSYTCSTNARCLPGDCYFNGCVTGFECQSSTGTWQCAPTTGGEAGAGGNEDTGQAGTAG